METFLLYDGISWKKWSSYWWLVDNYHNNIQKMSVSESQYYEAKVFLKSLTDAYRALEYLIVNSDNQPSKRPLWQSSKLMRPIWCLEWNKDRSELLVTTFRRQMPSQDLDGEISPTTPRTSSATGCRASKMQRLRQNSLLFWKKLSIDLYYG